MEGLGQPLTIPYLCAAVGLKAFKLKAGITASTPPPPCSKAAARWPRRPITFPSRQNLNITPLHPFQTGLKAPQYMSLAT